MLGVCYTQKWRQHSAPYDAKNKCWVLATASEMNGDNIWVHMSDMTLRINVGCFSLTLEMNGGNIRLLMMLK